MWYLTDLYGRNGKGRKAESESINDRPKRSMIGPRVENTENFGKQCTGYMLPPFVYSAISSTKLAAFVVRRTAGRKGRGYVINDRTCVHDFGLATRSCSGPIKFYGCSTSGTRVRSLIT